MLRPAARRARDTAQDKSGGARHAWMMSDAERPPLELFAPNPDDVERVWVPGHVRRGFGKDIYVAGHWRAKTKTRKRR